MQLTLCLLVGAVFFLGISAVPSASAVKTQFTGKRPHAKAYNLELKKSKYSIEDLKKKYEKNEEKTISQRQSEYQNKVKKKSLNTLEGTSAAKSRQKRHIGHPHEPVIINPVNGTIEIGLLIDYSLYTEFSSSKRESIRQSDDVGYDLRIYFGQIIQGINRNFQGMQNEDVQLSVVLTTIVVLAHDNQLPDLVENHRVDLMSNRTGLDVEQLGFRFQSWLLTSEGTTYFPQSDFVILLTGNDLFFADDPSMASSHRGDVHPYRMCEMGGSWAVYEGYSAPSSLINSLTQVISLSIGVEYDGFDDFRPTLCDDDNHIMTWNKNRTGNLMNQFFFSCCSQRNLYAVLSSGNRSCLFEEGSIVVNSPMADSLPGELYTADDQCNIQYGTDHCVDEQIGICSVLYCMDPLSSGNCLTNGTVFPALDGTECAPGKWCYRGECISNDVTPTLPDQNCNIRDCYGTEMKCADGTNMDFPFMFMCYSGIEHCDYHTQCSDESDEADCRCPLDHNRCVDGIVEPNESSEHNPCVPYYSICDGFPDCPSGSDEWGCCSICGFTSNNVSQGVVIPINYPRFYYLFAYCMWTIVVDPTQYIKVTFTADAYIDDYYGPNVANPEPNLHPNISCADVLLIYSDIDEFYYLCGKISKGLSFILPTYWVEVDFFSDRETSYPGWVFTWEAVPNTISMEADHPNMDVLTADCIDDFAAQYARVYEPRQCDPENLFSRCGNYSLVEYYWTTINPNRTFEDFVECDRNPECAREYIVDVLRSVAHHCELHTLPRKFSNLQCSEYAQVWFASFDGARGVINTCLSFSREVDVEPVFKPRPPSRYNGTPCELASDFYGVCQMNNLPCANGSYIDGLCRHPSNNGKIASSNSMLHRSCCVMNSNSGYDPVTSEM